MSHVQQVGAKRVWSVHASFVTEPFAYIAEVDGSFRVEDVEDGPLGWRRTFDEAVALVERHADVANAEQVEHNGRVSTAIAVLDGAA